MNFKLDTGSDANILNMLKLIQPMSEVSKSSITMRAYNSGCIPKNLLLSLVHSMVELII